MGSTQAKAAAKAGLSLGQKIGLGAAAVAVVAGAAFGGAALANRDKPADTNGMQIGYASEASVMLDENSLQAAVDEAMANAADGNVALQYRNNAYSDDGTNFDCRIVNSASNAYDMFLTIFADAELTDRLYLSGLVPPGSGFETLTLEHALDPGDHTVYVVLTQVDLDENGEQVMVHQVSHTMDFHVTP